MRIAALSLLAVLTVSPTLATTPAAADCKAEVEAMLLNASNTGPARIRVETDSSIGQFTVTGEIIPTGKSHIVIDFPGQQMEVISIGDEAWLKTGAEWTVAGPELIAATAGFSGTDLQMLAGLSEPQCLGMQTIEGVELLGYSFAYALEGITSTNLVYIDPATKFPARMESDIAAGGDAGKSVMTYEYDPTITITAPVL